MKEEQSMKSIQKEYTSPTISARWQKPIGLCLVLLAGIAVAQDSPVAKAESGAEGVAKVQALKNEKEQLSYALGMAYGNQVRKQSLDLDSAAFIQGLNDARAEAKTLLTEGEARALILSLQEDVKKKQLAAQAEKLQAENEESENNRKAGAEFLAANKEKEGVVALQSGLQYKVLKAGEGGKPTLDDTVVCHYKGTTVDGKEFDSTYILGKPATMPLKGVIKGWQEALQLMPVGSKWQLFIPSQLAYGARAAGKQFGPNSTLIFEIELVSIADKSSANHASTRQANPPSPRVAAAAR
jgi:FKBP-type peptidyl-prolyl cis-trans isomerase FklB